MTPDAIMRQYHPELYEEIVNGPDDSTRSLSSYSFPIVPIIPPDIEIRFPDLPGGCLFAMFGWIISLVGVVLALIPLITSPLIPSAVGNYIGKLFLLRFGSSELVIDQFFKIFQKEMTSGNNLKVIWGWTKAMYYLSTVMGAKIIFQGIKDAVMEADPPLELYLYLLGSLLLQIIAWYSTAWIAFAIQAAFLAVQIAIFRLASINLNDKCEFDSCKVVRVRVRAQEENDCDDGNMCTEDEAICESGAWNCQNTPVICPGGFSCSPTDGTCKEDDQLIPCVAVIDEDDSFGTPNQEALWTEFRTRYPARPFCLLVPKPEGYVGVPSNFLADDLTIVEYNIIRDDGDPANAEDWAVKCGLNFYTSNQVGYVGLFVDDSGSMRKYEVQASYDKFKAFMATQNIEVKEVVNGNENWILPFLTTLVPPLAV